MKLKKWVFLFVWTGALLFFSGVAMAESGLYLCKVVFIGTNPSGTFVSLTDLKDPPDFDRKVFRIPDDTSGQTFELAKSALLFNKIVAVRVDPEIELGEVFYLRLLTYDVSSSEDDSIPVLPFLK